MELLVYTISDEIKTLCKNNIRLKAIGDLESLPAKCYAELMKAIDTTKNNNRMTLILALSYSSKWEITNAIKKIGTKLLNNELTIDQIDQDVISSNLCTSEFPDPALLIRTSGEYRISNFLLWQLAYTELYFTKKLWPDFRKKDLYDAILDFQKRERRFGKTSEQVH